MWAIECEKWAIEGEKEEEVGRRRRWAIERGKKEEEVGRRRRWAIEGEVGVEMLEVTYMRW